MKITTTFISLFLISMSLVTSCKKKEIEPGTETTQPSPTAPCDTTFIDNYINDTIFPSPYLMTYPGSSWSYDNGTTETCDAWAHIGIATTVYSNGCTTISKDYHYLPHTSFFDHYISGTASLKTTNPYRTISHPLLATVLGEFYDGSESFGTNYANSGSYDTHSSVTEILDSMVVLGVTYYDVIHVHSINETRYSHSPQAPYPFPSDYYFANNVGLIRSEIMNVNFDVVVRNLTSYTIGPH